MLHSFCISNKTLHFFPCSKRRWWRTFCLSPSVFTFLSPVKISPCLGTTRRGAFPIMASSGRHLWAIIQAILHWLDGKLRKELLFCTACSMATWKRKQFTTVQDGESSPSQYRAGKLGPGRHNEVYMNKHSCATGMVGQAWEDPDMLLHKGDCGEARFQGNEVCLANYTEVKSRK